MVLFQLTEGRVVGQSSPVLFVFKNVAPIGVVSGAVVVGFPVLYPRRIVLVFLVEDRGDRVDIKVVLFVVAFIVAVKVSFDVLGEPVLRQPSLWISFFSFLTFLRKNL